jgi:hypothetical protein
VSPRYGVLLIDIVQLMLMVALALRFDRWWLLFATGFHILGVLTHLAVALDPDVHGWAYSVVLNLIGYLMFVALIAGSFGVSRRRRRELAAG